MTTARPYLTLVPPVDAEVIPMPRRPHVAHSALRHTVLREAAAGIITRDDTHTAINGYPVSPATTAAIDALAAVDLIRWYAFGPPDAHIGRIPAAHVGWITETGVRQLAEWDGPHRGGDAA